MCENTIKIKQFMFHDLVPNVLLGTASDRYAGWIGQIYSSEKYEGRIKSRTKTIRRKSYTERTLPVESVQEYFEHFQVLEIDYTFYSPLLDPKGQPTRTFEVLKRYRAQMKEDYRVILKVPQIISARNLWRKGRYVENGACLDPEIFRKQFYEPAVNLLGSLLTGMVFEQEYERKNNRVSPQKIAEGLDRFFEAIPKDGRYHIELRTEAYLSTPVFQMMEKHAVGQVLSHWTWLPALKKQLAKAGGRVFSSENQRIIRLMTPMGIRYEDAYARAHPFEKLVDGMLQPQMVKETADLMKEAGEKNIKTSVIINNRSGGNAPMIARKLAEAYFAGQREMKKPENGRF